jgi:hypothetical protein
LKRTTVIHDASILITAVDAAGRLRGEAPRWNDDGHATAGARARVRILFVGLGAAVIPSLGLRH